MFANGLSSSPSNTPAPLRPRPVPGDHHPGQCPRPASAADRAVRRPARSSSRSAARWAPSRPISGAWPIPTWSSASRRAAARRGSAALLRLPRGRQGGAHGRPDARGRRLRQRRPRRACGRSAASGPAGRCRSSSIATELYGRWASTTSRRFLVDFWEAFWLKLDANDLLSQLHTWQTADISTDRPATTAISSGRSARSAPRRC